MPKELYSLIFSLIINPADVISLHNLEHKCNIIFKNIPLIQMSIGYTVLH